MTTRERERQRPATGAVQVWVLCIVSAGLLITSGIIHLHLWDIAYRHVKTLDVLFPLQAIAAFVVAVALLAVRRAIVAAVGALLMAGTIVGFILARTAGIFGFKLSFSSGLANTVLIVEAVAIVSLALTAWVLQRRVSAARG